MYSSFELAENKQLTMIFFHTVLKKPVFSYLSHLELNP